MHQVWKCTFCTTTNIVAATIANHEKICAFNPAMQRCWTCKHRTVEGSPTSGFWNGCCAGVSRYDQEDIEDTGNSCPKWELEELPCSI